MITNSDTRPRIRLWPALVMVILASTAFLVLPIVAPRSMLHFVGGIGGVPMAALGILIWWVAFSRVRGTFRWLPLVLFLIPAVLNVILFYPGSPLAVILYGFPLVTLLWVLWLIVSRPANQTIQLAGVLGVIIGGWTLFSLVRIGGANAEIEPELEWRWQPTKMELYKQARAEWQAGEVEAKPVVVQPGDWAEFRGPNRDNVVPNLSIETDWDRSPPQLLWKHRIGSGWGSFSVVGDRLFTQEQVDENQEAVTCYEAETGKLVWEYRYNARFYEQIAGVGPRCTPTIVNGRAYTFGGTGELLCLDASTGAKIWERNIPADTSATIQQWGYSSSPLVVENLVVVFANGPDGRGTIAYRADSGEVAWTAGNGKTGYSSAQFATLNGVGQILMVSDVGVESYHPADGKLLWVHDWYERGVNRVSQPTILNETDFLVGTGVGGNQGTRRVRVTKSGDRWQTELVWFSKSLKPYFNDCVVQDGYCYGFDDKSLACIDLKDGSLRWKTGTQYGHGQVLLLAEQKLLLVQAVSGRVVLVEANPEEHFEIARFPALDSKTWNHPVIAHGKLFVRNNTEAAAYKLTVK